MEQAPTTSIEQRTCLLLAKYALLPQQMAELHALTSQPVQWKLVLEQAIRQQVFPLVWHNIQRQKISGVPPQVAAEFQDFFRLNALRDELMSRELARLLNTLHVAGIPVIPLKGPALAQSLFGDSNLRACSDLDLLIPRAKLAAAVELLGPYGYQSGVPRWVLDSSLLDHGIQLALHRSAGAVDYVVEFHWSLFQNAALETHGLRSIWEEAGCGLFHGAPHRTLSPEWQLLYLAVHAGRHNWQGLKWLVDIDAATAVTPHLDWHRITALAREMEWDQVSRWTLGACHALLETPLPADIPFEPPHRLEKLVGNLNSSNERVATLLPLLRAQKSFWGMLGLIGNKLFRPTPAEFARYPLPRWLRHLYFALRPVRLLQTAAGDLLRKEPKESN